MDADRLALTIVVVCLVVAVALVVLAPGALDQLMHLKGW